MKGGGRTRTRIASLAGCAGVILLMGCYEHTYQIGAGAPLGTVVYDQWRHHWLWGLISPGSEMALEEVCPSGNATIKNETTFLNGLVAALTSGIYSPTSVEVRCATRRNAQLDLEAEDVVRIVSSPRFLDWVEAVTPELLEEATQAQLTLQD